MMQRISGLFDSLLGRGSAAVTVPPLDGALKPNSLLEDLPKGIRAEAPDNLVVRSGTLLWSEGGRIVDRAGATIADAGSEITAMAASQAGLLAVATVAKGLSIYDPASSDVTPRWQRKLEHVTALDFARDGRLFFCVGSRRTPPTAWSRDLMERNVDGWVGQADVASGAVREIGSRLAYPNGIVESPDGALLVSESWASHIVKLQCDGRKKQVVFDEIPGYPGRLSRRSKGGYWLAIFAPRNQLIEFVLREPRYRKAMIRDVPPSYWVAPAYRSGDSFHEPLQGGALKQMGILKPWAPTRSYGLVVELDENIVPVRSFHSRSDGTRHGITSVVELDGELWMSSRGGGEVLNKKCLSEENGA
jgi:hypothetical protein